MSIGTMLVIALGVIILIPVVIVILRRRPRRLKVDIFTEEWKSLQGLCKDKDAWPIAIAEAERLLHKALKLRRFKGKSMGERMVSAQRVITNNDSMWFAHNLYKKLAADDKLRLKEDDVKAALIGYRQALKDIGALESGEPRNS